jgi:hypothetical protein
VLNRFTDKNKAERTRFWSMHGRGVKDIIEAALHEAFMLSATGVDILNIDFNEEE